MRIVMRIKINGAQNTIPQVAIPVLHIHYQTLLGSVKRKLVKIARTNNIGMCHGLKACVGNSKLIS